MSSPQAQTFLSEDTSAPGRRSDKNFPHCLLFATRFATSGLWDATSQKIANGTYFPVEQVSDLRMGAGQAAVRVMIQCKL